MRVDASSSVLPTHKFLECEKIKDFIHVPVPRVAMRDNLKAIDHFLKSNNEKTNARPGEKELCIKSCVLLKAATILGDEFDTKSLQAVSPFRSETLQGINKMVKLLEENDFLEVLDELEKENFVVRFNRSFLRESLYQVMLYKD